MCGVVANAVRADLFKAGFVTNEDKSVWIPSHRLDWLGITWDSVRGTIEIVDRRVVRVFYEFYLERACGHCFLLWSLLRQFWKVHFSSGSRIAKRRLEL